MRLIEFHPLGPYRNLRPRPIRFTLQPEQTPDNACSIRFLVGPNGVGKTNLLRFLADIFLALEENYRGQRPDSPAYSTPYRLTYELHGDNITIHSQGEGRSGVQFTLNGESREPGDIPALDRILPQALMVYTSGDITPWHTLFTPAAGREAEPAEDDDFDAETLRREEEQLPKALTADDQRLSSQQVVPSDLTVEEELSQQSPRRSYLTRPEQLPVALLVALLHHQAHPVDPPPPFADILADVNVRLISFSLRYLPNVWALYPSQRRLLRRLFDLASVRLQEGDEQVWIFDLNALVAETGQTTLAALADDPLHEPFQLFQALVQMESKGILNRPELVINYRPPGNAAADDRTLLAHQLSDGELAFISRMALIYLLRENECLFLLDEPETHFNDDWKRNLVDNIERALQETNSEVILTTHASIVLTDAFAEEIILLTGEGQEPIVPLTFAAEQGEPLRALFGAERSVGRRAMRWVEAAMASEDTAALETLLQQVGPGYYRFQIVKELQRRVSPD